MGVLFGSVTDEDTSEETLESVFHYDLCGYQIVGNRRWVSMLLKRPKRKGSGAQKKKSAQQQQRGPCPDEEFNEGEDEEDGRHEDKVRSRSHKDEKKPVKPQKATPPPKSALFAPPPDHEIDPDDLMLTVPLPQCNLMLAVLRNTLYLYAHAFSACVVSISSTHVSRV